MLCGKLHYQKVFNLKLFSFEIPQAIFGFREKREREREERGGAATQTMVSILRPEPCTLNPKP